MSRRTKKIVRILGAGTLILLWLHACNFLPTSRLAYRPFILRRDYEDLKRIFKISQLPKSVKITELFYPGFGWIQFPSPSGPGPVEYRLSVNDNDFKSLCSNITSDSLSAERIPQVAFGPVLRFDKSFWEQLVVAQGECKTDRWHVYKPCQHFHSGEFLCKQGVEHHHHRAARYGLPR